MEREVVTERLLANVRGIFYEVPNEFAGGGVRRMRPIATHNLAISDFMSWRGMLVLAGNQLDAAADDHYVKSSDGKVGLWFGNVDDLWSFGPPRGFGGPWNHSQVAAEEASDPYLMTGFDQKELQLCHTSIGPVEFTIEVDFLGTGEWRPYLRLTAPPGKTVSHRFPVGYSAHWVRIRSHAETNATASLVYQ
jgi:hypothetical protein